MELVELELIVTCVVLLQFAVVHVIWLAIPSSAVVHLFHKISAHQTHVVQTLSALQALIEPTKKGLFALAQLVTPEMHSQAVSE